MPLAVCNKNLYARSMYKHSPDSGISQGIERSKITPPTALHTPDPQLQPASVRRRSLNISHFNALQNAVSNLSRIDDFELEELGYGFFSDVFKATHKQTGKVMVLKRNKSTNTKMNILREVQLMNRLSHPHILKFKGVCVHEGQLHALTEFINGGDLDQLVTKKDVILSWKQRTQIALDVSKGMKYLHSMGIFHRDLTAKNCLVRVGSDQFGNVKYTCVVADLGLAEKIPSCEEDEKRLAIVGTPYIMAPEVLQGKPYNEKADIFSFGLLVCQLIALVSSDPEELPRSSDFGLARDLFSKMVMVPAGPESSPDTTLPPPKSFLQLAYNCCLLDPKSRPSFNEIVVQLEDIVECVSCKHTGKSTSFKAFDEPLSALSNKYSEQRSITANESPPQNQHLIRISTRTSKRKRSLSPHRLSRSFSEISRELLNHAANMETSSPRISEDDSVVNDAYSNPFSALEHLRGGEMKFTDEPSIALLEMTFDLATSDSLKTSWSRRPNTRSKRRRPKSICTLGGYLQGDQNHLQQAPPSPPHLSPRGSRHLLPTCLPRSHRTSTSEETLTQCKDCDRQRAMHRAMILSPLGNNLASWWCCRQRSSSRLSAYGQRHSLATIMSLLSKNMSSVRRSISLPDLSRISTLFHSVDSSESKCFNPGAQKRRSNTADDVFYHDSKQEVIKEESETDVLNSKECDEAQTAPPVPLADEPNLQSSSAEHTCNNMEVDSSPLATLNLQESYSNPQGDTASDKVIQRDEIESVTSTSTDVIIKECGDFRSTRSISSSSSSSGCSTSSLTITLQTGELTQRKRLTNSSRPTRLLHHCHDNTNSTPGFGSNNFAPASPTLAVKSNNRDSGYEEGGSHAGVSPGYELSNHHVTWNIPEEPTILLPLRHVTLP